MIRAVFSASLGRSSALRRSHLRGAEVRLPGVAGVRDCLGPGLLDDQLGDGASHAQMRPHELQRECRDERRT